MYPSVTISTHCFIEKKYLKGSLEQAKNKLTVWDHFEKNPFPLYLELPKHFGVPRYHFLKSISKKVIDARAEGSKVNFEFTSELWENQVPAIQTFAGYVKLGKTGIILEAPPAFGKTVVILKMLSLLKRTALIIVPRSNLVKQWVDRILQHTSLKRKDIGIISGGKCDFVGKSLVVGLVHSIVLDRWGDKFSPYFGVVVYDEVDRSVPPTTFNSAVTMFPAKYRIAASATLKRRDGLHAIFEKHIGECYIRGSKAGRLRPKVVIVKFEESSGYVHAQSSTLSRRGMLISRVSNNPARNMLISYFADALRRSGRRTVIMSDRTDQLVDLKKILTTRYKIPPKKVGFYVGALTYKDKKRTLTSEYRQRVADTCEILLATFGMMQLGTDIPDLAGMVIATPQSSIVQPIGRIERKCDGKKQPIIIDIVDTFYKDSLYWGRAREKVYRRRNLEIVRKG